MRRVWTHTTREGVEEERLHRRSSAELGGLDEGDERGDNDDDDDDDGEVLTTRWVRRARRASSSFLPSGAHTYLFAAPSDGDDAIGAGSCCRAAQRRWILLALGLLAALIAVVAFGVGGFPDRGSSTADLGTVPAHSSPAHAPVPTRRRRKAAASRPPPPAPPAPRRRAPPQSNGIPEAPLPDVLIANEAAVAAVGASAPRIKGEPWRSQLRVRRKQAQELDFTIGQYNVMVRPDGGGRTRVTSSRISSTSSFGESLVPYTSLSLSVFPYPFSLFPLFTSSLSLRPPFPCSSFHLSQHLTFSPPTSLLSRPYPSRLRTCGNARSSTTSGTGGRAKRSCAWRRRFFKYTVRRLSRQGGRGANGGSGRYGTVCVCVCVCVCRRVV